MSSHIINREDSVIEIQKSGNKNRIRVDLKNKNEFSPALEYETYYNIPLIEKLTEVKGPAWVCNEIMRDECPEYISNVLKYDILSYVHEKDFTGKRILDFGCGCGASTIILARMFPECTIVGVEYVKEFVEVCEMRKEFYNAQNLSFIISPSSENLPENAGTFDYILLSGVFEHLLTVERVNLFPKIWGLLKEGGIMFLNGTPHKYFPIEMHTTSGLPFINYLPENLAFLYATKFSKRGLNEMSWDELLRDGIRGGSAGEIMSILKKTNSNPVLLKPANDGVKDRIDVWYKSYGSFSYSGIKKAIYYFLKSLKAVSGIELTPYLSLAIKKATIAESSNN